MPCFLFFKDDLSRGDGIADQAGKFHAQEGGVGGAGSEGLFYCPYGTGVKQDKVGRRTLADAAGIEMIEIRRIAGEAGEELPHGQISGLHKVFQAQGESSLQADHSAGSLGEILRLFEIRVGRVIGGDQVDRAVRQALYDRAAVLLCAQRRVYLGESSAAENGVFRQGEMMRRCFRVDPGVLSAGFADKIHTLCGGYMLDTEGRTGPDCQLHISADQGDLRLAGGSGKAKGLSSLTAAVDPVLGDQCFILLVETDGQIQVFCRQQGFLGHRNRPSLFPSCPA